MKKNKSLAFTLAEVLITLGIIGIVAALTLPSLIQKQNEKATVTALKKFYSSVSQAYMMAKNEHGTVDIWYSNEAKGSAEANKIMFDKISKYLKISKACDTSKGCFADVVYKKIDGNNASNWNTYTTIYKFITADGMSVFFNSYGNTSQNFGSGMLSNSYGAISVDINGFKKPNIMGRDMFSFVLTKEGLVPVGVEVMKDGDSADKINFPNACNINDCKGYCEGCAAWVIYNENMDYLHCNDLSWNGKTKCK